MKAQYRTYRLFDGNLRQAVKITKGTGHILYIGDYGYLNIDDVKADGTFWETEDELPDLSHETGSCWPEGRDQFLAVYDTRKKAEFARDYYYQYGHLPVPTDR